MRSETSSPMDFFNKMKKKPALQAILDTIDNYTTDELQEVKGQPLWIRKVLVELKTRSSDGRIQTATMNAEKNANEMMKSFSYIPHTKFEIRLWFGNDWFMPCGITGGMSVEIKYGDFLIIYDHAIHKAGISSSIGNLIDVDWSMLINNSKPIGMMTKLEYSRYVSDKLGKGFRDREEIAKNAGPNSYVEPNTGGLFTITRHGIT